MNRQEHIIADLDNYNIPKEHRRLIMNVINWHMEDVGTSAYMQGVVDATLEIVSKDILSRLKEKDIL